MCKLVIYYLTFPLCDFFDLPLRLRRLTALCVEENDLSVGLIQVEATNQIDDDCVVLLARDYWGDRTPCGLPSGG